VAFNLNTTSNIKSQSLNDQHFKYSEFSESLKRNSIKLFSLGSPIILGKLMQLLFVAAIKVSCFY